MANKNFRIRPEGGNDFADVLHPETNTGMVLDKNGNPMLKDYVRFPGYAKATGIDNYVVTLDPAPVAYVEGMRIAIKISNTNTGVCTLNINNLGARSIVDPEGNTMDAGDLTANQVYNMIYTSTVFQLLGKGGDIEYGDALPEHVLMGKTIATEEGLVPGTMPNIGNTSKILTNQNQSFVIPKGFQGGAGVVKASITNLLASNIKKGVNVGGVTGTYEVTAPSVKIKTTANVSMPAISGSSAKTGTGTFTITRPVNITNVIGVVIGEIYLDVKRYSEVGASDVTHIFYGDLMSGIFHSDNLFLLYSSGCTIRFYPTGIRLTSSYIYLDFTWESRGTNLEKYGIELSPEARASIIYT